MQQKTTVSTMQGWWATSCVENLKKSQNEMKTIGSVYNIILMQSCHERTEGIGQEECEVSSTNAVLLHSYAVAIGSVLHGCRICSAMC